MKFFSGHRRSRRNRRGGQLGRARRRHLRTRRCNARTGGKLDDFHNHIKRICEIVDGPVSAESVAMTRDEIIRDGRELAALADNVVVKIPTMVEGLAATKALSEEGIPVQHDAVLQRAAGIMAARAGARYISPFVGRFDDIAEDGISQLADVVAAVNNYDFGHDVEIIAASVRSANTWRRQPSWVPTSPRCRSLRSKKCVQHPLTDRGLDAFMKDWEKVQQA